MRIFWWQAGLHMEPENQEDLDMLKYLMSNTTLGRSEEPATLVPGEQIAEGYIPRKPGNKQPA